MEVYRELSGKTGVGDDMSSRQGPKTARGQEQSVQFRSLSGGESAGQPAHVSGLADVSY